MIGSEFLERRSTRADGMALVVEIGVNYARTIDGSKAVDFMRASGVPDAVIERVTGPTALRRRTCWERTFDEAALRKTLGARPLLSHSSCCQRQRPEHE